jgi:hypothetical protein
MAATIGGYPSTCVENYKDQGRKGTCVREAGDCSPNTMEFDAIGTMNERGGFSQAAIKKFVAENQKCKIDIVWMAQFICAYRKNGRISLEVMMALKIAYLMFAVLNSHDILFT